MSYREQFYEGEIDGKALLDVIDAKEAEAQALRYEVAALRRFAGEIYQVLGALDAPENVLDNASDAASGDKLRHETLLPFADLRARVVVPEGKIVVSEAPLRRLLHALSGEPHLIRELQATRHHAALFKDNPINVLVAEYNAAPAQGGE